MGMAKARSIYRNPSRYSECYLTPRETVLPTPAPNVTPSQSCGTMDYLPPTVGSRILADDQGIFHNGMTEGLLPLQPRALRESVEKGVTQEPPGASKTRTRESGRNEWSRMNKSPAWPLNPKSNLNGCMRFLDLYLSFTQKAALGVLCQVLRMRDRAHPQGICGGGSAMRVNWQSEHPLSKEAGGSLGGRLLCLQDTLNFPFLI